MYIYLSMYCEKYERVHTKLTILVTFSRCHSREALQFFLCVFEISESYDFTEKC